MPGTFHIDQWWSRTNRARAAPAEEAALDQQHYWQDQTANAAPQERGSPQANHQEDQNQKKNGCVRGLWV